MANDEIDYNIVFPDAGTSGECHFVRCTCVLALCEASSPPAEEASVDNGLDTDLGH